MKTGYSILKVEEYGYEIHIAPLSNIFSEYIVNFVIFNLKLTFSLSLAGAYKCLGQTIGQERISSSFSYFNSRTCLCCKKEVEYEVMLRALNDRLMLAERGFLDVEGLQGRQWFMHLIYGPPSSYESKLDFFPGIANALSQSTTKSQQNRQAAVQHEIWRVGQRPLEGLLVLLKGISPESSRKHAST
ncbi:hypothetical protein NC653_036267 [Populus alba x Populus x berolinensis]|uniref:Transferrin receptor-like dimerisation domain-containing protein n=1 Tax=Populus alba x Populus x berolinensis TaxID=444605 RepID=A0AAD6LKZ2_9ROSI|nr:hypothetical protein NC653_036267 [Populus alba x Populus x berolinensis]